MARTHGHGNPKWARDETILALNLYFGCDGNIPDSNDKRIRELSEFLRALPHHHTAAKKNSFRNPDGVAFKLQNLRQVATGKGLANVSETDRSVWAEFGSDPEAVKKLAALIRSTVANAEASESDDDNEDEFSEGRVLTEVHKRRERDRRIRRRLLTARRKLGALTCDMCLSGTPCRDPKLEDALFEAHHVVPISSSLERKTRLSDMALVCANCHRLLHRAISIGKRWLGVADGKKLLLGVGIESP